MSHVPAHGFVVAPDMVWTEPPPPDLYTEVMLVNARAAHDAYVRFSFLICLVRPVFFFLSLRTAPMWPHRPMMMPDEDFIPAAAAAAAMRGGPMQMYGPAPVPGVVPPGAMRIPPHAQVPVMRFPMGLPPGGGPPVFVPGPPMGAPLMVGHPPPKGRLPHQMRTSLLLQCFSWCCLCLELTVCCVFVCLCVRVVSVAGMGMYAPPPPGRMMPPPQYYPPRTHLTALCVPLVVGDLVCFFVSFCFVRTPGSVVWLLILFVAGSPMPGPYPPRGFVPVRFHAKMSC